MSGARVSQCSPLRRRRRGADEDFQSHDYPKQIFEFLIQNAMKKSKSILPITTEETTCVLLGSKTVDVETSLRRSTNVDNIQISRIAEQGKVRIT